MGADKADELAAAIARCEGDATRSHGKGHKLASDAAAKLLSSGKLRQAEKAYLELVLKHSDVDSYIGLARTQAALEDMPAAIETLREGAAKMAGAGDRANAVSLLAETVALAPLELAAHRRLAAALANQGDLGGAVDEYARYVDAAMNSGDSRRALLEIEYGRETLGDLPRLLALVDRVQRPGAMPIRVDGPRPDPRLEALGIPAKSAEFRINVPPAPPVVRAASPTPAKQPAAPKTAPVAAAPKAQVAAPKPAPAKPQPQPQIDPRLAALGPAPLTTPAQPTPVPANPVPQTPPAKAEAQPTATKAPASARTRPDASQTAVVLKGARTFTHAEQMDFEAPVDMLVRAGVVKPKADPRPAMDIEPLLKSLTPTGSGLDAAAMATQRAALLTSAHDVRATDAALDAAQRLLALGKLQSASDVLLDLIAHGFADREAQRLLIEVDCAIGRRDMAKEKCTLLGHAYRLDGRREVAEDVERLARIL